MENKTEMAKKWLEEVANHKSHTSKAVKSPALAGIEVVSADRGRILCKFLVPKRLTDKDGNWSAGAIATLIDDVGFVAVASTTGLIKVSVHFGISYFSTAKINEEVEIEATTLAHMGKLSAMTVEIRKKESGEMVALGKQWMASINIEQREALGPSLVTMEGALLSRKWLENLAKGRFREGICKIVEPHALAGIEVVRSDRGRFLCKFIVPKRLTDKEGNWHPGAIATLIDAVGTATIMSHVEQGQVSVDFQISYFSTAKIDEEVEIDAKVLAHKGKVTSMVVEIRKKESGEMVALGKQWMQSIKVDRSKL